MDLDDGDGDVGADERHLRALTAPAAVAVAVAGTGC